MPSSDYTFIDREVSWLAFSDRVLQEAADQTVPPLERLLFCAIFSSNLDEWFSVRVASLRKLLRLGNADKKIWGSVRAGSCTSSSVPCSINRKSTAASCGAKCYRSWSLTESF